MATSCGFGLDARYDAVDAAGTVEDEREAGEMGGVFLTTGVLADTEAGLAGSIESKNCKGDGCVGVLNPREDVRPDPDDLGALRGDMALGFVTLAGEIGEVISFGFGPEIRYGLVGAAGTGVGVSAAGFVSGGMGRSTGGKGLSSKEGDAGATLPDERLDTGGVVGDGLTTSPAEVKEVVPASFEARALRYAMTVSTDSVDGVALPEPTLSRYFVTACIKDKVGASVGSSSPVGEESGDPKLFRYPNTAILVAPPAPFICPELTKLKLGVGKAVTAQKMRPNSSTLLVVSCFVDPGLTSIMISHQRFRKKQLLTLTKSITVVARCTMSSGSSKQHPILVHAIVSSGSTFD